MSHTAAQKIPSTNKLKATSPTPNTTLTEALARSNFDGADLSRADLRGCDMKSFNGANLRGADLSDTSFRGAFMTDVIFSDLTYFEDTDL